MTGARVERCQPSPEWTQEERIRVALDIISDMKNAAREGRWAKPMVLGDMSDRLAYILTMPSKFLESNREHILNGQFTLETEPRQQSF